jgi:hypothetical protein
LNPALSPQAEEIVLHALQRKPSDRYSSMAPLTIFGLFAVTAMLVCYALEQALPGSSSRLLRHVG